MHLLYRLNVNKEKWLIFVYLFIFLETNSVSEKNQWPELIGTKGEEAVKIIKQETGKYTQ